MEAVKILAAELQPSQVPQDERMLSPSVPLCFVLETNTYSIDPFRYKKTRLLQLRGGCTASHAHHWATAAGPAQPGEPGRVVLW